MLVGRTFLKVLSVDPKGVFPSHTGYCLWAGFLLVSSSILFLYVVLFNDDDSLPLRCFSFKIVDTSLFNPPTNYMRYILYTF